MTTNNFKPILFSTEMVQAILAGRKTQTRRVLVDWDQHKPKFIISGQGMYVGKYPEPAKYMAHFRYPESTTDSVGLVAPIQPGDILWVRETAVLLWKKYEYQADGNSYMKIFTGWKPSIHMPKEAARIFLKVTNVRVERLQEINAADSIAEGIGDVKFQYHKSVNPRIVEMTAQIMAFRDLWDSINAKKHPWDSNPWVWVYEFERIEKPENFLP